MSIFPSKRNIFKSEDEILAEEKRREEREADARSKMIDYKRTFESEHGKRVLTDLMDRWYFLRSSASETVSVSEVALMERGHRQVIEDILKRVFTSVEDFEKLLRGK